MIKHDLKFVRWRCLKMWVRRYEQREQHDKNEAWL